MYIFIYLCAHIHKQKHVHIHIHTHIYMLIDIYIHAFICSICTHIHLHNLHRHTWTEIFLAVKTTGCPSRTVRQGSTKPRHSPQSETWSESARFIRKAALWLSWVSIKMTRMYLELNSPSSVITNTAWPAACFGYALVISGLIRIIVSH